MGFGGFWVILGGVAERCGFTVPRRDFAPFGWSYTLLGVKYSVGLKARDFGSLWGRGERACFPFPSGSINGWSFGVKNDGWIGTPLFPASCRTGGAADEND